MGIHVLKASLIVVILMGALCVSILPIVNASGDVVPLNWTSPTTNILMSVHMVSSNDGWAVGYYGTIIHWDGTNWTNVTSPTTSHLHSVFAVNANDGWAVGEYGTIIRWTGTEWVPEFPTVILGPLLITLTLVAVILTKTVSKKQRRLRYQ